MKPAKQLSLLMLALLPLFAWGQKAKLIIPMGHAQQITQIAVSHDYNYLASIDNSNIIHIWEMNGYREFLQLSDHTGGMVSVDFHPFELKLVSNDRSGNVIVWDVSTGAILTQIKEAGTGPVIFNGDGTKVLVGGQTLKSFDAKSGDLLNSQEQESPITALVYAPFYDLIVCGSQGGGIQAFDDDFSSDTDFIPYGQTITNLTAYDDAQSGFIACYADGSIARIDLNNEEITHKEKVFDRAANRAIVNSNNGKVIAVGSDSENEVKFLDASLKHDKTAKFKWSSKRVGVEGLKGIAWRNASMTEVLLADDGNTIKIWSITAKQIKKEIYKGTARPIYDMDVNADGETLVIGSRHGQIKVLDLTGSKELRLLRKMKWGNLVQLDFHYNLPYVLAVGKDQTIKIYNTETLEILEELKKINYLDFNMQWTTNNNFIRKVEPASFEVYDFRRKSKRYIKLANVKNMKASPDDSYMVFQTNADIRYYNAHDLAFVRAIPVAESTDFSFAAGETIILKGTTVTYHDDMGMQTKEVKVNQVADMIFGLEDGGFLLYSSQGSHSGDYNAYYYDQDGQEAGVLKGHNDYITKVLEVQDRIMTSSLDGSIKMWTKPENTYQEEGSLVPLRLSDYVVTTPSDLFDATPNAMRQMYFNLKGEIVGLEQLKDVYYEPNLLTKLSGFDDSPLRKPKDLNDQGLAPKIEITQHPNKGGGLMKFTVSNNGGGIGRVSLIINGKEASSDLRLDKNPNQPKIDLEYDIVGHPFLYDNKPSRITILAYNKDESISSEPKNIFALATGEKSSQKPKIYAVVIGTSDYADDAMDLKYAAKDAQDFASALRISSTNLVGAENIKMTVLTTNKDPENWPTKEKIKATFENYAKQAKARDYLIVYMAGHGVNSGGEDGDFYYLTCTAKDGKVFNEDTRKNHAISSYEFTEYIKSVPALNQVMIVDACHSGTLTSALGKQKISKSMSSEEVKAYERMKDRTGIFLLAGSAADAVSYETTLYGQGLLTYALLFGMKGAALHENEFVDVMDLFQYAAKKVPQLAQDIGGIQRPEVRVPIEAESFNIGKMTDKDKANIDLVQPKPVFVHTSFQDENEFHDVMKIGKKLDEQLFKMSKTENAPLLFMNENQFSGALEIRGRYKQLGQLIVVDVKVFDDTNKKLEFKVEGVNAKSIADRIIARLMKFVSAT